MTALLVSDPAAVLRRLRASGAEIDRAAAMTAGPEAPASAEEASVRRWLATVGKAADDLIALWALRHGTGPAWATIVQRIRERGDPLTRADLALGGGDLQALGIKGPRIGQTLALLLERVLEDPSRNTRDTLLSIARDLG
jgi:tRNA nucleotidyltransferase (CCA-adding enzyme)